MTNADFAELLDRRIELTKAVLASKSQEYATAGDKLHNFKRAAELVVDTPARALLGMLVKHWVSVMDLVDRIDRGQCWPAPTLVDEKIGDAINYLILLEAIFAEQREAPK